MNLIANVLNVCNTLTVDVANGNQLTIEALLFINPNDIIHFIRLQFAVSQNVSVVDSRVS